MCSKWATRRRQKRRLRARRTSSSGAMRSRACKLGRPVKWLCDRSEAPLADDHARDVVSEAELALDAGHRFLALRVRNTSALGAYVSSDRNLLPSFANLGSLCGTYLLPAAHVSVTGMLSHTSSLAPYRGNGR